MRTKLRGAFDLALLFGRGIKAFSGDMPAALKSFLIPLLLFPFSLALSALYPPRHLHEGFGLMQVLGVSALQSMLSFTSFTVLTYFFAMAVDRKKEVLLFFEANNWTGLVGFLMTLPFFALAIFGSMGRDEMDYAFIMVFVYFSIVTACIAYSALRLNWQLAGFIGCLAVVGDQTSWQILMQVFDIPYTWDY